MGKWVDSLTKEEIDKRGGPQGQTLNLLPASRGAGLDQEGESI